MAYRTDYTRKPGAFICRILRNWQAHTGVFYVRDTEGFALYVHAFGFRLVGIDRFHDARR